MIIHVGVTFSLACSIAGPLSKSLQQSRLRLVTVRAASTDDLSTAETAALVSGAIFNPVVLYSEWTLFQTGKGLDPGPAGIYGALEGVGLSDPTIPFLMLVSALICLLTLRICFIFVVLKRCRTSVHQSRLVAQG